jgi:hypothetical protein
MLLRNPISDLRCSPYFAYGCASRPDLGLLAMDFDTRFKKNCSHRDIVDAAAEMFE